MRALFLFVCVGCGACLAASVVGLVWLRRLWGLFGCAARGVAYRAAYKADGAAVVYRGDGAAAVSSSG